MKQITTQMPKTLQFTHFECIDVNYVATPECEYLRNEFNFASISQYFLSKPPSIFKHQYFCNVFMVVLLKNSTKNLCKETIQKIKTKQKQLIRMIKSLIDILASC